MQRGGRVGVTKRVHTERARGLGIEAVERAVRRGNAPTSWVDPWRFPDLSVTELLPLPPSHADSSFVVMHSPTENWAFGAKFLPVKLMVWLFLYGPAGERVTEGRGGIGAVGSNDSGVCAAIPLSPSASSTHWFAGLAQSIDVPEIGLVTYATRCPWR